MNKGNAKSRRPQNTQLPVVRINTSSACCVEIREVPDGPEHPSADKPGNRRSPTTDGCACHTSTTHGRTYHTRANEVGCGRNPSPPTCAAGALGDEWLAILQRDLRIIWATGNHEVLSSRAGNEMFNCLDRTVQSKEFEIEIHRLAIGGSLEKSHQGFAFSELLDFVCKP